MSKGEGDLFDMSVCIAELNFAELLINGKERLLDLHMIRRTS